MQRFTRTIYKIGINPVIDPPEDALEALFEQAGRSVSPIPVRGRLNGAAFVQTLVKFRGSWRLYVNGEMLKASGLHVGDEAAVEMEFDPDPRDVPEPPKFIAALGANGRAREEFDRLSPARRKEILRYLGALKTDASLDRNIERVLKQLRGERPESGDE